MSRKRWVLVILLAAFVVGALCWLLPKLQRGSVSPQTLFSGAQRKMPVYGYVRFAYTGSSKPFLYAQVEGTHLRLASTPAGLQNATPLVGKLQRKHYQDNNSKTGAILWEEWEFPPVSLPPASPQVVNAQAMFIFQRYYTQPDQLLPGNELILGYILTERDRAGALWQYVRGTGDRLAKTTDGGQLCEVPDVIDPSRIWVAIDAIERNGELSIAASPRYGPGPQGYFGVRDQYGKEAAISYEAHDAAGKVVYQGAGDRFQNQTCSFRSGGHGITYHLTATLHGPDIGTPISTTCTFTTPVRRPFKVRKP